MLKLKKIDTVLVKPTLPYVHKNCKSFQPQFMHIKLRFQGTRFRFINAAKYDGIQFGYKHVYMTVCEMMAVHF